MIINNQNHSNQSLLDLMACHPVEEYTRAEMMVSVIEEINRFVDDTERPRHHEPSMVMYICAVRNIRYP